MNDIMERINSPKGIAKNSALKENLLLLYACIVNKIPLFLTGNPGSSKTLSINLIYEAFRGNIADNLLLRDQPCLYFKYY